MSESTNPILNNPYEEPKRHYATQFDGKLDYEDIRDGRRIFVPVNQSAIPSRAGEQKEAFDINEEGVKYEAHLINRLRNLVRQWRDDQYPHVTKVSKDLLNHWFVRYEGEPRKNLFYAQREALETAIFLNEAAPKSNPGTNILEELARSQKSVDPGNPANQLPRIAFKMATGTGKTVVMAGLIIYHYLNRQNDKSNTIFADYFLVVAPSITIRDRLQVLFVDQKSDNFQNRDDYYAERNLVPRKYSKFLGGLNARIKITNYHSFTLKNLQGNKRSIYDGKVDADGNKTTESETPTQMVKRVMGDAKFGRRLLVLNDEAHHCYLPKSSRKSVKDHEGNENEKAALWYTGLTYIANRYKLSQVYDLSATPYYLNGSGYEPYSLFPWVVSDFGLVEAIESGLVKIPFLPEKDDTHQIEQPVLRNIYEHVKDKIKNRGYKKRKKKKLSEKEIENEKPYVPPLVKSAIDQLYSEYKNHFTGYRKIQEETPTLLSAPPVMILVCNNTRVSRDIYKYIAGYEIRNEEGEIQRVVEGQHELFSNYDDRRQINKKKPPTILIDSEALDDAGQINKQFKGVFELEIQEFKRNYATQYGQGAAAQLTDADILREVVNTVGKNGRLGSHVRCVVSVSMLTEGWDANNVTHIMGLRAFQSQLLCEQVAGRALRRMDYGLRGYDKEGNPTQDKRKIAEYRFPPEYATIIGVPFQFFKGGEQPAPEPSESVQVRALPEREGEYEIKFPVLEGYRREFSSKKLTYDFSGVEPYEIEGGQNPTRTTIASAFSDEERELEPEKLLELREQQIIYELTNELMQVYFRDDGQLAMFGKLKEIVEYWYDNKLKLLNIPDQRYKRFVRYEDPKAVSQHIRRGINPHENREAYLRPIFMNKYEKLGSTRYAHGLTTREVFPTEKSHLNYAVADSDWEQIFAKTCEEEEMVKSYVKNDYLGFNIPYNKDGVERMYRPDFILKVENSKGVKANVIIEISGYSNDKDEKKWYTTNNWLPAVNSVREKYGYEPWYFYEIANDIRDVKNHLIAIIEDLEPVPENKLAKNI
jgi:type III restriction enzyme